MLPLTTSQDRTMTSSTHTPTSARPRVLITGGGAGIGAAAAQRCRDDGYEPIIIDRVADHIPGAIQADLSDIQDTARALNEALQGGPITRLINNVGVVVPNDAASQTLAEFDLAVQLNLRCAFQCMQALLPGMKDAQFGRIVNMSSRAALGKDLRTAYAASKAGLIGLTKSVAKEYAARNITANAVAPGFIETDMTAAMPESARAAAAAAIPAGRIGRAEDVAAAVAFLAGEQAGYITGQVLCVDGGMGM